MLIRLYIYIVKCSFFGAELIESNSQLLDEKHELEYKLSKTSELSQQQISELEASVDHFNQQVESIRAEYGEQLADMAKQCEQLEAQRRLDKAFIDAQLLEREQERDDYEAKIEQLTALVANKRSAQLDQSESLLQKVI